MVEVKCNDGIVFGCNGDGSDYGKDNDNGINYGRSKGNSINHGIKGMLTGLIMLK